jgi:nicotinate-nucleotide pyrophosphorylase (carboxylating)
MGLYDQVLLKDNHMKALAASEGLSPAEATAQAIRHARVQTPPGTFIGVEVTRLEELRAALSQAPDLILLDNMSVDEIRQCVALVREIESQKRPLLEVSGGVSLDNVRRLAETGIDRISIGALTHSAPALDIALELE